MVGPKRHSNSTYLSRPTINHVVRAWLGHNPPVLVSQLRILQISPYSPRAWSYGGIPRVLGSLTGALAARGHDVVLATTDAEGYGSRLSPVNASIPGHGSGNLDSVEQIFPNLSNQVAYHWQIFLPRGMRAYLRAHARDFDVAHIHACRNLPGEIAARELTRAGVPYLLSPHGTAPRIERRQLAKQLFDLVTRNQVMRNAARVIAVSDAERRQLRELGVPDARIVTIPNPIDLAQFATPAERGTFRRAHQLDAAPVVTFLGKLTPRKRLDILAQAFARLSRANAHLVIAGNDMGYERELRALVAQLGIADRTQFTGLLAGSARLEALADADVVVYASKDEIFGLVPLEAILCGTPVVVANDSGCGEVIRKVGGGLIVPEGEPEPLAQAIATILDAPVQWRQRAVDAQPNVRALCSPDRVCEQLENVYREIIDERRK